MNGLFRDARHAARALSRSPGFTLTGVATLALGIGVTTAVFSVVESVLLRPLPYPESDRLITIRHPVPGYTTNEWSLSRAGFFYFREHAETLDEIGLYRPTSATFTGDDDPEQLPSAHVSWSALTALGVAPVLGRPLTEQDDLPGSAPTMLLGYGLWQRRFGGDPAVLGRTVTVNGSTHEVIGVMPEGFAFPTPETAAWLPMRLNPAAPAVNQHTYPSIARMKPDVELSAVATELQTLVGRFSETFPQAYSTGFMTESQFGVAVYSLLEDTVGAARRALWIVLGTAVLVLLMACANVANLLMVRSETHSRDLAVRSALGAGPGSLFRYSVLEGGVLTLAGGLISLLVAWGGVRLAVTFAPAGVPRVHEIGLNTSALVVTFATMAIVTFLFGWIPLFQRGDATLSDALRGGTHLNASGKTRTRVRASLAVSQVAMALVLMAGSGLLLRSYIALRNVDLGFEPDNILTFRVTLTGDRYAGEASLSFIDLLDRRLEALPGVHAVGTTLGLPVRDAPWDNLNGLTDLPGGREARNELVDTRMVGEGYFEALGMRITEGRAMERVDHDMAAPGAVVTRSFAAEHWPGQSALGKRIRPLMRGNDPWHTIVGIVDEVHTQGINVATEPTVYFPYTYLRGAGSMLFAIKTQSNPMALLPLVRQEIRMLDPDLPMAEVTSMAEIVTENMAGTTFTLGLLSVAAIIAIVLGAVGLYGVVSYVVNQRTAEIGLRIALGASANGVLRMVIRQTMVLAAAGVMIGVVASLAVNRTMESLLVDVSPSDVVTLGAVSVVLLLVTAAAGYLPARRAARVDPLQALRAE